MGRIRTIKPELLEDQAFASLSDAAARLLMALYSLVDDEGHCPASPEYILGHVFYAAPRRATAIRKLVAELVAAMFIVLYEANGQPHLAIVNWRGEDRDPPPGFVAKIGPTTQRIDKPQSPKFPLPPWFLDRTKTGPRQEDSRSSSGKCSHPDPDTSRTDRSGPPPPSEDRSAPSEQDPRAAVRAEIEEPPRPGEPPPGMALELPGAWTPAPEPELDAEAERLGVDLTVELAKLRDRERARPRVSADWQANWREWLRRGIDYARERQQPTPAALALAHRFGGAPQNPSSAAARSAAVAAVARAEAEQERQRLAEESRRAAADRDENARQLAEALRTDFLQLPDRCGPRAVDSPPNEDASAGAGASS